MSAHTMTAPKPLGKRKAAMLFAPLAILVTAAVVTQFGGGVTKDAKAAAVTVTASVQSDATINSTCGSAGDVAASFSVGTNMTNNTAYEGTCTMNIGSTNSTANLNVSGNSATLFGGTLLAVGANCTTIDNAATNRIGIRADVASTATRIAAYACAAGTGSPIPTGGGATICSATVASRTCILAVRLNTGTSAAGAMSSGTLTTSLT